MNCRSVIKRLSPYFNGELSAEEAAQVSEHIRGCANCAAEAEKIETGSAFANLMRRVTAPEDLWVGLSAAMDREKSTSTDRKRSWLHAVFLKPRPLLLAAAIIVIAASVAVVIITQRRGLRNAWAVDRLAGAPRIGSKVITERGRLKVGQWMETDSGSKARLHPGLIGEVDIEPDSKLQLLKSDINEYRLALQHGELKANISAPPRLFFVNTPSGTAIDVGCAYVLHVDDSGGGEIEVTSGMVEFEAKGRKSTIPSGAACLTRPNFGPGTPFFLDAPSELKAALPQFDFSTVDSQARAAALNDVLSQARRHDSLTLWHLISRVNLDDRKRLYTKLAQFVPPPPEVNFDGIMRLDPTMLELWLDETVRTWYE